MREKGKSIAARLLRPCGAAALFALAVALGSCASSQPAGTVHVTLAAINDFHGFLEAPPEQFPMRGAGVPPNTLVDAGGVAHLATLVRTMRAASPNFAFVSSGDLVGATPLLASMFDDEPVIEAMNAIGLDIHGVGNHEFDRGAAHLKRLAAGGCPEKGCRPGAQYEGARFPFLAANVFDTAAHSTLFPPYVVKTFDGVKVAFIGLTTIETPAALTKQAWAGLEFRDEVETVNALVPELRRNGVEAIVVLIHEGGLNSGGPNECVNLGGRIGAIAKRMDPAVDVILSAHTHHAYNCTLSGKLVTSSGSYGRFVTQVDLEIDRRSRDIVVARAENRLVNADIAADRALSDLLERYRKLSGPIQRVVGKVTDVISRYPNRDGESKLGQLTADAQLEATRSAGAVAAFMNPGGIRSALPFRNGGDITYADVFTVNPFSNTLLTITLSGAQILRLLEQQWAGTYWRVLQVSSGVSYAWDERRPVGERVVPGSVTIGGKPLDPAADYRITVNNFMAGGGDGFTVLLEGRDRADGPQNREAFMLYLQKHSPVSPGRERRIARAEY